MVSAGLTALIRWSACRRIAASVNNAFDWTAGGGIVDLGVFLGHWQDQRRFRHRLGHRAYCRCCAIQRLCTSKAGFFNSASPGTPTQLANMPSVSIVFNGGMAINDNDWVVASGHYLWEPAGGGTVIDLEAKLTAAGVAWSSVNMSVRPQ